MNLLKDLNELISENVISKEIAHNIESYYKAKKEDSTNKLFIVFGILGAILVGLGIILILAHNWDELSRLTKTIIAFTPLVIGQISCGFSLLKKPNSIAWKESSSAFLVFAIGASISLISQIYNIPGNINSFLLTWLVLSLPLVYLMRSSITSLLYIAGLTIYACNVTYWDYPSQESYIHWFLLALVIPHYYYLFKNAAKSNFINFHHWFIPLSIIITLGSLANNYEELMYVAYISLFSLFYGIGELQYFKNNNIRNNSYKVLGSLGTIITLMILSFSEVWEKLQSLNIIFYKLEDFTELIAISTITISTLILLIKSGTLKTFKKSSLIQFEFLIFIPIFIIGIKTSLAAVLVNILVFSNGILIVKKGNQLNHLGILNYGLLIITVLVICRFFDTDLSFVIRGLLFVSVGVGFFIANYLMLKKRRNEK